MEMGDRVISTADARANLAGAVMYIKARAKKAAETASPASV